MSAERKASIKRKRTQSKIDKDRCDELFSMIVRASGPCLKCGKPAQETSHIYSRRYASVRCDPMNVFPACHACHRWWHDRPVDAVTWLHETLPADHLVELARRMNAGLYTKVDWSDKRKELTAQAKELGVI